MNLSAILRPVSRARKNALVPLRVAAGALLGASGAAKAKVSPIPGVGASAGAREPAKLAMLPARGEAGMLRAALVVLAVFLAAGVAGSVSFANASVTRSDHDRRPEEDGGRGGPCPQ